MYVGGGPFDGIGTMERHERDNDLESDDIRRIPLGRALMITGTEQAAAITLEPWWTRGWKPLDTRRGNEGEQPSWNK